MNLTGVMFASFLKLRNCALRVPESPKLMMEFTR